jgi:hypothetical protein
VRIDRITLDECASRCRGFAPCIGFTFDMRGMTSNCFLKDSLKDTTPEKGFQWYVSGKQDILYFKLVFVMNSGTCHLLFKHLLRNYNT